MKKTDETKTLSLRRETLKELSLEDLRRVAGASRSYAPGACFEWSPAR